MIDVRIVCTHDAVKTAQMLMRVLAAEGYSVDVVYGRGSLAQLEQSCTHADAIILIWSLDAPSAHYMLQWQTSVDPARLVEIARAPGWPDPPKRRAPVIDFTSWGGERGGAAWRALHERLRAIARASEPPRPAPKRAAIALGAVSALAVGGALILRIQDASDLIQPQAPTADFAETPVFDGLGGPLQSMEPASVGDGDEMRFGPLSPRADMIAPYGEQRFTEVALASPVEIQEERLLDRLTAMAAPLLQPRDGD